MPRTVERLPLMSMTPGTARSLTVLRYGRAGARPKVYMQAAIHSNEFPGSMALAHLIPMLDRAQKAGRIKGEIVVLVDRAPPAEATEETIGAALDTVLQTMSVKDAATFVSQTLGVSRKIVYKIALDRQG